MSNNNRPLLQPGTLIKNKWQIQQKLGSGSFGEIYSAIDTHSDVNNNSSSNMNGNTGNNSGAASTNASQSSTTTTTANNNSGGINNGASPTQVAIKVEKCDSKKTILKLEVIAIKHLQECERVVRYVHSGRHHEVNFLVMEKLGDNLAQLRKVYGKKGRFSMSTTLRLGIQMIECLEGVHKLGYVHRDVKPSNFVINLQPEDGTQQLPVSVHVIDFGLARKFILPNGEIRPPRKSAGFRGTVRYASINSHESLELGPHDDIWSVFYSLVEFATGSLPWMKIREKAHVLQLKKRFNNESLVDGLPEEFLLFMKHLQGLKYGNLPDYELLKGLLQRICDQNGYKKDDLYDWQKKQPTQNPPVTRPVQVDPSSKTGTVGLSKVTVTSSQDPNNGDFMVIMDPNNHNNKKNTGANQIQPTQSDNNRNSHNKETSNKEKTGCKCIVQ